MFRNYKYFSSCVSVLVHIILFTFLLATYKATNNPNASLIEVGFGGEPGGGGGGAPNVVPANPEEKIPTKEPTEKKTKAAEKPKPKEIEGTGTSVNTNPNGKRKRNGDRKRNRDRNRKYRNPATKACSSKTASE